MPNRSDQYETFVAGLIGNIRSSNRLISELQHGRNNKITGICGQQHQIDVSFFDDSFPAKTLVLIECKRHADPIELAHAKTLKATLDDIVATRGMPTRGIAILVSCNGAQSGAKRYADYYGIKLETVNHGPDYAFQYEDIIQIGMTEKLNLSDIVTCSQIRTCPMCRSTFLVNENETYCSPDCENAV